ncbi:MAG TPA: pre-peptidase C-terminal domain-containing protein [Acidimicrobiales bacterium]|nr:pre-peptidase C-terminal domain-containing protein [Acidimicrobiales bacterium]
MTGTGGGTTHTTTVSLTVTSSGGGGTVLTNGVPVNNLSGATNSQQFFSLAVPAGATNLTFQISGGTGDADLYVRFGAQPTTTTWDCRPFISGNNETCSFPTPQTGTYFVMLNGFAAYSGVTLVGSYTSSTPDFAISASPSSTSIAQGSAGNVTVSTTVSGGFNSAVALSASGQPSGVTVAFNPTSIAAPGSGSSTMTITVGSTVAAGTYTITVTGTGGGKTHTTPVTLTVTSGAAQQLLGNPGFETGTASPWVATTGVINNSTSEPPHSGSWDAWMDGYGTTHTDSVYQQVTIPSTATTATLTFFLHIDTAETTTTTAFDTLQVQVRNSANTVLATLATYSNLDKNTGYAQKSFNLIAYKGQTIRIYFLATEDSSLQTSFVIDDITLNVQ